MTNYEDMSYRELQALCKKEGIKANQKKNVLIKCLQDLQPAAEDVEVTEECAEVDGVEVEENEAQIPTNDAPETMTTASPVMTVEEPVATQEVEAEAKETTTTELPEMTTEEPKIVAKEVEVSAETPSKDLPTSPVVSKDQAEQEKTLKAAVETPLPASPAVTLKESAPTSSVKVEESNKHVEEAAVESPSKTLPEDTSEAEVLSPQAFKTNAAVTPVETSTEEAVPVEETSDASMMMSVEKTDCTDTGTDAPVVEEKAPLATTETTSTDKVLEEEMAAPPAADFTETPSALSPISQAKALIESVKKSTNVTKTPAAKAKPSIINPSPMAINSPMPRMQFGFPFPKSSHKSGATKKFYNIYEKRVGKEPTIWERHEQREKAAEGEMAATKPKTSYKPYTGPVPPCKVDSMFSPKRVKTNNASSIPAVSIPYTSSSDKNTTAGTLIDSTNKGLPPRAFVKTPRDGHAVRRKEYLDSVKKRAQETRQRSRQLAPSDLDFESADDK